MEFLLHCASNQVWYGTFSHFNAFGIKHGLATRVGGVSQTPYNSLNIGMRSGDDINSISINRKRLYEALGIDLRNVVNGQQIHSDHVAVVTSQDKGRGAMKHNGLEGTDALITNVPGIALMVFFADCVPILFVDPKNKAIGVCHAGWRGTAAQIAAKTIEKMHLNFGTYYEDCLIGIGPSIGQCCYEVDDIVISQYKNAFTWWKKVIVPYGERWKLDLGQTNYRQLLDVGVSANNIVLSNVCTACNTSLFYSYRAEQGKTGVQAALISL